MEVPSGGGPNPRVKSRACWLMGRHYGGNQCHQSALVKKALLQRFWTIFRKKLGDLATTEVNLLPRDSWTWEEFTASNSLLEPLELGSVYPPPEPLSSVVIDAESALDPAIEMALAPENEPAEPVDVCDSGSEDDDISSTTSSSASDVTAAGRTWRTSLPWTRLWRACIGFARALGHTWCELVMKPSEAFHGAETRHSPRMPRLLVLGLGPAPGPSSASDVWPACLVAPTRPSQTFAVGCIKPDRDGL